MKRILVVGSLNMDFVVDVEEMPLKGETILAKKLTLIGGGKGANQACAAGKLGTQTAMLGAVGSDSYGEQLLKNLSDSHVDTSRILRAEKESTGMALITVNCQGENSITVIPGANYTVTCDYIEQNRDIIEQSDYILLQLEIPLETVLYTAKLAHRLGKTVILDPAPAPDELPCELLELVDYIKPNETELQKLTKVSVTEKSLKTASEKLKEQGAGSVIVTLGGDGIYALLADGKEYHKRSKKVDVVDTTAAGDSFTGAFAAGLSQGKTVEEAIDYAGLAASVAVTRKGAQSSLPTSEEIERILF